MQLVNEANLIVHLKVVFEAVFVIMPINLV